MGKAEMNGEMMDDAMEMMENPGTQEDAEDVYNSILGEIGMEISSAAVGGKKIAVKQQAAVDKEETKEDAELEARLAALRMV